MQMYGSFLVVLYMTNTLLIAVCFLTAIEHFFQRDDISGTSRNPVDAHLVQASPLHFLCTASHHMWNQHSLLSGGAWRKQESIKRTHLRCLMHGLFHFISGSYFCFSSDQPPSKNTASLPETSCMKKKTALGRNITLHQAATFSFMPI